jgi:Carboxypeptidase regulatory-like domain
VKGYAPYRSMPISKVAAARNFATALGLLFCAALIALCIPCASYAQDTGYISGTVIDKSGAAVVGAEITLTNAQGSLTRSTTSNSDGAYTIAGLPGDSYNLSVTAKGFQKYTAQNVKLNVAEKARIDVTLTVGAMSEEITVTGESVAQVETQSSALSATVTGRQVEQLELNGRQFTQLAALSPGVANQTFGATGTDDGVVGVTNIQFSINGGRYEYNNWELDGGDNMDNGSNATLNVYPNLEAIAEFKVLTSNYGAQYGRNGSGTVEVETKSGGSSFHGSAFYYNRNELFKARSWAEGADPTAKKAPYKKHDYGYTIGGPVYIPHHYNSDKKKTFFFWSQEWRRENVSTTILQNVPSDAERTGDFSDLCPGPDCPTGPQVVGNKVVPSAVGTALLAIIPTANTTNGGFPAVTQTIASPTTWREQLIRIDHNLTNNYRLTFRYIHDSWQTVVPTPLWGNGTSFQNVTTNFVGPGTSFVARLNANFTPTLLNEFVASYTGDHIFLSTGGPVGLPSGFAMGSIFNNGFGGKLPAISVGSNNAYGGTFTSDTGYFPWHNANPTYTYRDNMTKVFGQHTFQFGAYFVFAQKNEANSPYVQGILSFDSSDAAVTTGNAFADLLLGNVASYQQTTRETQYYNRYRIAEPYFQDDWRVTKRLTLNLGLRVSLFGTYRERFKQAFNLDPASFNPANVPTFNADGSLAQNGAGTANPLNGFVQCGGPGGSFPYVPGSAFPSASVGSSSNAGCLKGHLFNPAPRIGFAFDPKGDGKMAIRGGYGVFFEHTNGNEGNTESLEGSAPLVLTASQSNIIGYQNIGAGGGGTIPVFPISTGGGGADSIPDKAVWPYVQQWNLSVQRELPFHLVGSLAYVGSKGTHLTSLTNVNQFLPVSTNPYTPGEPIVTAGDPNATGKPVNTICPAADLTGGAVNGAPVSGQVALNLAIACGTVNDVNSLRTIFPGYGNIGSLRDVANSVYHSFQASATRTVGDLTLSFAYTYSHSIDDSSDGRDSNMVNSYDFAANRASSNFDLRHNVSISYVYALPFFHAAGFAHSVLGGWQVSGITVAQSGTPFNVTNGLSTFGDNAGVANGTASAASRPDLVGSPGSGFSSTQDPANRGPLAYNPAAFAAPTGLTFGNVGRNTLTLPSRVNFDFGLFKRFALNERAGFEFRWETFNLFNHTQYSGIDSAFGPSTFLHLNATHDPRRMQFGLRFYF